MPRHVTMSTQKMEVGVVTTAPEFSVTDPQGRVYGDLRVSLGGVFWRAKNDSQYRHLTWEQVDALFKERGAIRTVGEYKWTPPPTDAFVESEAESAAAPAPIAPPSA
jgi:hypothetical protein